MATEAAEVVRKNSALKDLADSVRDVMRRATWMDSDSLHRALRGTPSPLPFWTVLSSERQAQVVLRGVAASFANQEIAGRLGVSKTSVKCTIEQILV